VDCRRSGCDVDAGRDESNRLAAGTLASDGATEDIALSRTAGSFFGTEKQHIIADCP